MKKLLLFCLAVFQLTVIHAQDDTQKQLVKEGTELHDKGDYEGAIKKYDEAIALNNNYLAPYFEKAYSLYAMKKLEDCLALCQSALARFKEGYELKMMYGLYGNCLDDMKKPEEALKVYDEGLSKFPDDYLLNYNKAITLNGMGRTDEAIGYFEKAIAYNPKHASSHKAICALMVEKNKIPSLMAGIAFLCYEPQGKRAEQVLAIIKGHIGGNVKKEDEKHSTITLNIDDLDTGKKGSKKENSFGIIVLLLSLSSAIDNDSTLKNTSPESRMSLKVQMLANVLSENQKGSKGFYWTMYAPFIIDMKKQNQVETFAHIAYASDNTDENNGWLSEHKDDVKVFYDWLKNYQWTTK